MRPIDRAILVVFKPLWLRACRSQVPVTFKGSRVDPIISPSSCIQISASSLDQDGYGIITYECTIANASLAASTFYNFTSIGRIPGA